MTEVLVIDPGYDRTIMQRYPAIPWLEPVDVNGRITCRLCIARYGLKASELATVTYAFDDLAGFNQHMAIIHGVRK